RDKEAAHATQDRLTESALVANNRSAEEDFAKANTAARLAEHEQNVAKEEDLAAADRTEEASVTDCEKRAALEAQHRTEEAAFAASNRQAEASHSLIDQQTEAKLKFNNQKMEADLAAANIKTEATECEL